MFAFEHKLLSYFVDHKPKTKVDLEKFHFRLRLQKMSQKVLEVIHVKIEQMIKGVL